MNEAKYLIKSYGDRGDLHNSSFDAKAEFNSCLLFIQNNSYFENIAKTSLPASMLSLSSIVYD